MAGEHIEEEAMAEKKGGRGSNLTQEDRAKGGRHSHGGGSSSDSDKGRQGQHNASEEGRERVSEGGKKGGSK